MMHVLPGCRHGIAIEPVEPVASERETLRFEMIEPRSPLPFVAHQPCFFELLKVPRRRRPGMGEQPGDLARRHRAAGEIEADQDAPPRRVGEGYEEGFVKVGRIVHWKYLAQTLNMSPCGIAPSGTDYARGGWRR